MKPQKLGTGLTDTLYLKYGWERRSGECRKGVQGDTDIIRK